MPKFAYYAKNEEYIYAKIGHYTYKYELKRQRTGWSLES